MRKLPVFVVAAAVAGTLWFGSSADSPASADGAARAKPGGRSAARPAPAAPVPDSAMGLSRSSVFSVPAPPTVVPNPKDPPDAKPLPRMFAGAPPRIPHAIAEFLPITRQENQCRDCHDQKLAAESGAVPMPATHYRDLRRAPQSARQEIAGARYVCVSCHVPLTDAAPLPPGP